jgi:hypothetical protein
VFVDPSLGPPALANARDLVNDAGRVVSANDAIFGTPGGPVDVIVFALGGSTDGGGGADHMGCDFTTGAAIEVCASFGSSARVSALFEAELSECSMNDNLCGSNTGEALSRWCAAVVSDDALPDFATAPAWAQNGMPDFVNQTDGSDTNPISTGCGMAFLSWLLSKGHALNEIAPAMVALGDSGTLAQLYAKLTQDAASNAFPKFIDAVNALPGAVTSDDPFGGFPRGAQSLQLAPATVELAGKIFSSILADLAAGKADQHIVAGVRNLLAAPGANGAVCSTKSHRLRRTSGA